MTLPPDCPIARLDSGCRRLSLRSSRAHLGSDLDEVWLPFPGGEARPRRAAAPNRPDSIPTKYPTLWRFA